MVLVREKNYGERYIALRDIIPDASVEVGVLLILETRNTVTGMRESTLGH